MESDLEQVQAEVQRAHTSLKAIQDQMGKTIVGQKHLIDRLLIGLLANGHVLLEGVPGLAKTLAVSVLAECMNTKFQRIQFTPDLLPSDLIGNLIYNPKEATYFTKKGPIFANLVLADEINRAPAKVQSALLEAMQERQVTIGEETFPLPSPFLVLATMNPIEQEGTYSLPEAQVDRFMLKVVVTYPNESQEKQILRMMARTGAREPLSSVVEPSTIVELRKLVDRIHMDERVEDYVVRLVFATREPRKFIPKMDGMIRFGASPRATINLTLAAKAHALISGRAHVTPIDVKSIAMDVLRHRVITTFEAEAEDVTSEAVVDHLLENVIVP